MNQETTIDCEEALRRLFEYVDAELGDGRRREMDRHLERCRSCFSRVEFERRLKAHVAALGSADVPPTLEQRVRAVIDEFTCS
jgi:mycothiol system anti-sigma-R factor